MIETTSKTKGNLGTHVQHSGQAQTRSHKRGLASWPKRVGLVLLLVVTMPIVAGLIYQMIATAIDNGKYPAPGQMVDVGGYKLHIYCTGEGSPTVILDASSIDTVSSWG